MEYDFLSRCLQYDPSKRWSADLALQHPALRRARDVDPDDSSAFSGSEVDASLDRADRRNIYFHPCNRSHGSSAISEDFL